MTFTNSSAEWTDFAALAFILTVLLVLNAASNGNKDTRIVCETNRAALEKNENDLAVEHAALKLQIEQYQESIQERARQMAEERQLSRSQMGSELDAGGCHQSGAADGEVDVEAGVPAAAKCYREPSCRCPSTVGQLPNR